MARELASQDKCNVESGASMARTRYKWHAKACSVNVCFADTHIHAPFCCARTRAKQDGAATKVQDQNALMLKEYQERTFTPEALAYYHEHPFGGKALSLSLFITESLDYCYYEILKYRVRQHWPGRGDFPSGYFLSQLFKSGRLLDQVVHHSQRGGYHS